MIIMEVTMIFTGEEIMNLSMDKRKKILKNLLHKDTATWKC